MPVESPAKTRPTNAELARSLGVHPAQIGRWIKKGCPTESPEAVQKWRSNYPRPPRTTESQQRFGNQNGKGKNTLEQIIEKWGLAPPPSKYGRKLTPELVAQVSEHLIDGFTNEEVAILCDVQENTIAHWCKLSPIKKAVFQRKRYLIHQILDGTRRDWCRVAWFLERRFPDQFAKPEIANLIRTHQSETNITQNLVISTELATKLTARSASVQKQVKKLFAQYSTQPADQSPALLDRAGHGQDAPG
jgi:hypothetical protein